MTEKEVYKLLRKREREDALGAPIAILIIAFVLAFISSIPWVITWGVIMAFLFWLNITYTNHKDRKDGIEDLLFIMYPDKKVLVKVMDEVINHPIYKSNGGVKISEHFILYGDQYENIIRLYDVTALRLVGINDTTSKIGIMDRFGQKHTATFDKEKAKEVYKFLIDNCKNAEVDDQMDITKFDNKKYIDYDETLTEEYCFYEGPANKKSKKKEDKKPVKEEKPEEPKEEKKPEPVEVKEEPKDEKEPEVVQEETETNSNMDQKYNDLKKLKELLDSDIITKEEFEKEKNKILKN